MRITRTGAAAWVSVYWLPALGVYSLLRFLLLALPVDGSAQWQQAERFLWLSFWPLELAVILAALWKGSEISVFVRRLAPGARILLAFWAAALVFSAVFSPDPFAALRSTLEWVVHGYFAAAVYFLISRDPDNAHHGFRLFGMIVPVVSAVVGLSGLMLVYFIGLDSGFPFATDMPGFAHLRHTGYIMVPALILGAGMIAFEPGRPYAIALFALNAGLCLWFGSRGPFMGLGAGLLVAALLFEEFRRLTFLLRVGAGILAASAFCIAIPSPPDGFNALERAASNYSKGVEQFSSGRTELWKDSITLVMDRPLVGYGGQQFQAVSSAAENTFRHPHNFVLQVFFDWGLLGGAAFLGMLTLALGKIWRNRSQQGGVFRIAVLGTVTMFFFALIDGILFYPYTIAITVVFVVYAMSGNQNGLSDIDDDRELSPKENS